MATAGDLITAAFIKVGIDSPTTAQTASALISLNNVMSLLGADFMVPVVTSESFTLAVGDPEYTIGSAGQWNTVRPNKVNSCFIRDSSGYDHPIKIIGKNDYSSIWNKSWNAFPTELYFLPEYPLAKIIFDSKPLAANTAYFEFDKNFTEFALTTTSMSLPNEYKEFFVYNLAVSLGEDWDRAISKTVFAQALRTREVVERLIAANRPCSKARFDFAGPGGTADSGYSIGSDTTIDGGSF